MLVYRICVYLLIMILEYLEVYYGISINNCRIVTGKNGDFISFPQYKGTNGEYYNVVYAKLSEEDTKNICALVQEKIDEM